MRKTYAILGLLAGGMALTPVLAAEGPADVDYDCALYNECTSDGEEEAGEVRGGFTMRRNQPAPKDARPVENVRGGFTMRREKIVETAAVQPAAGSRARIAPRADTAKIASAKPVPAMGNMQAKKSIAAAQRITFVTGSADLQPGAKSVAQKLAIAMMRPDKVAERFRIEGHTDASGTREANLELSERRALAVVAYLTSQGVDSKRLEVMGYGSEQPLPGVSGLAPGNRRVVAKVIN